VARDEYDREDSHDSEESTDAIEQMDWEDVEAIIEDLKRDGYCVSEFKSNTSEARPEKAFLLRVER